ncbi:MAG: ATP synthase F1 subunit delta [Clostridia bacterium]|nr:ATP synthase F1 subunit delta [Clostridia bacterium]
MVSIVSRKYSEALFLVAKEKHSLPQFEKDVTDLSEVFRYNKEIMNTLMHPQLPMQNKMDVVNALFKGEVSKEVVALLNVVLKKSRQEFLPEIFEAFIEKCKTSKNISTAVIMSAEKLDDKSIERIVNDLKKKTKKEIEVEEKIDDRLIGGVKVMVDNILYDGSIDGKIKNIYKAIS